jgi:DNA helicase HerA-like ATPase
LGSTGTGKSTSAALILHRICEAAPKGHILMIDPHGEYSAAFRQIGQILDVSNLQMPYWLMNFEEHCEVLLTGSGNDRQVDADILAKCLLAARSKSRLAQTMGKINHVGKPDNLAADEDEIAALCRHYDVPLVSMRAALVGAVRARA